jgi:hypothetical protein
MLYFDSSAKQYDKKIAEEIADEQRKADERRMLQNSFGVNLSSEQSKGIIGTMPGERSPDDAAPSQSSRSGIVLSSAFLTLTAGSVTAAFEWTAALRLRLFTLAAPWWSAVFFGLATCMSVIYHRRKRESNTGNASVLKQSSQERSYDPVRDKDHPLSLVSTCSPILSPFLDPEHHKYAETKRHLSQNKKK